MGECGVAVPLSPEVVTQCTRWTLIISALLIIVCVPITIYLSPHAPMWLKLITGISAVIFTGYAINFLYRFPVGTTMSDVKKYEASAKILMNLVNLSALVAGAGSIFIGALDWQPKS